MSEIFFKNSVIDKILGHNMSQEIRQILKNVLIVRIKN